MILSGYFHTILSVNHNNRRIGNTQSRYGCPDKVIRARTIYKVQLFPVPFVWKGVENTEYPYSCSTGK